MVGLLIMLLVSVAILIANLIDQRAAIYENKRGGSGGCNRTAMAASASKAFQRGRGLTIE